MGLFQRQPINNAQPLYTMDGQVTLLIVGLGNIGKEYEGTRHNIGFDVLDHFASKNDFGPWAQKKDFKCAETSQTVGSARVILCKPTTFMNKSGEAVQAIQNFYKIDNSKALVVYDELAIDFGQIRTRTGGTSAGHNGVKSLIQHAGEDFGRVRVGIGPKTPEQIDSSDFVLARFSAKEQKQLPNLLRETNAVLSEYAHSGGELSAETRSFLV